MDSFWTTPTRWLLHTAVGGGLLMLAAGALSRRTRQPAQRQRLGEMGLAAALMVAVLCLRPAWLLLPWGVAPQPAAPTAEAADPADSPALVFAPVPAAEAGGAEREDARPAPAPAAAPRLSVAEGSDSSARETAASSPARPELSVETLSAALVVVFALGAVFLLARWLLGHLALLRLLRTAGPAPDHVAWLFAAMAGRGRLRPRLLVSRRLRVPMSCGLLRPTVVLPARLCDTADARILRWVFAHELTHLERRDAWSCLLFGLGQVFYFYLPWFWQLRRQVRLCQEYIADAAVTDGAGAADYAEFLLTLTRRPALPVGATGVLGNTSDLLRRVTMLLQEPMQVQKRCPRRWFFTVAGGLLALAIVVSGIGLTAAPAAPVEPGPARSGTRVVAQAIDKDKDAAPKKLHKQIKVIVVPAQPGKEIIHKEIRTSTDAAPAKAAVHRQIRCVVVPAAGKGPVFLRFVLEDGAGKADAKGKVDHKEIRFLGKMLDASSDGKKHIFFFRDGDGRVEALGKVLRNLPVEVDVPQVEKEVIKALGRLHAQVDKLDLPAGVQPSQIEKEIARAIDEIKRNQKKIVELRKLMEKRKQETLKEALKRKQETLKEALKHKDKILKEQRKEKLLREKDKRQKEKDKRQIDVELRNADLWRLRGNGFGRGGQPRLGLALTTPGAALADQLDLPKGRGLLVEQVVPNSPAARAGFKANDVWLEVNGQAVPGNQAGLLKLLESLKSDKPLKVVVLRKGKKETLKGLTLAAPKELKDKEKVKRKLSDLRGSSLFDPNVKAKGGPAILTSIMRTGDSFTTRYQEGSLIITLTGSVTGGQAKVGGIHVQDGGVARKYARLDKVPEQYRAKVKSLIEMSEKGNVMIDAKER
jgi:beta-lactamase regulating signal transducer with metallopeptidase domain